jgi:hypothetical protein
MYASQVAMQSGLLSLRLFRRYPRYSLLAAEMEEMSRIKIPKASREC